MFLITLALTILVSELSYRYFETPFLRLKDVLNRRGKPRETLEVAANMAR
jgi:peptidoglycan/LPS O-acetylase OafA/YrhL